jgi:hypothetical protein
MRHVVILLLALVLIATSGCAFLIDSLKDISGYPSTGLVRAKKDAVSESFDSSYDEVYEEVLFLLKEKDLTIYLRNKQAHFIVVMGIEGCIDTTEVGIFFLEDSPARTTVQIASQSSKAKGKIAAIVFSTLKE